jgi:hypothetical protein
VKLGRDDPSLTPAAGVVLVAELDRILGLAQTIDSHVGRIKQRDQGLSGGEVVLSMAETMLGGGDFMVDLDHVRGDVAGAGLRAVPEPPASTTFAALAQRFDEVAMGDLEAAMGVLVARAFALMPEQRRQALLQVRPTIERLRRLACRPRIHFSAGLGRGARQPYCLGPAGWRGFAPLTLPAAPCRRSAGS